MTASDTTGRTSAFARNETLEELLAKVNRALEPAESLWLEKTENSESQHPLIFVMGPLRSGTTLFMQWLASTGIFAYPTNLLSRFYGAPAIGAMIQLLLTDQRFNFRDELLEFQDNILFESQNGKTTGVLSPNEFWYFWRRFIPATEFDWQSDADLLQSVDTLSLVSELNALTKIFNKPFALKGMILNYNIPFLSRLFDKALFIRICREPVENVASVLEARKRQYGSEDTWYSFKIPEYSQLKNRSALEQCAGQVTFVNRALDAGMSTLDDSRKLYVSYEEFCNSPHTTYLQLLSKLDISESVHPYVGPKQFRVTRESDRFVREQIARVLFQL